MFYLFKMLISHLLLSACLAGALMNVFGERCVIIAGSLIASSGYIISSQMNSLKALYFTYGILTGEFTPSLMIYEIRIGLAKLDLNYYVYL